MKLKRATIAAIVAICVLFLTKTLATFLPDQFKQLGTARVAVTLSTLAALVIVYFYYVFYRDYARVDQPALRKASLLAAIGAGLVAVLYIKGFLLVFDLYVTRFLLRAHLFEAMAPWLASIISLIFFIVFLNETPGLERPRLKKAIRLAVIASGVGIIERTIVLYNYLQIRESPYASGLPRAAQTAFIPFIIFAVGALVYFFVVFYQEQRAAVAE
ncbi:MAG: hypothetical protein P8181_08110 [bacterium]